MPKDTTSFRKARNLTGNLLITSRLIIDLECEATSAIVNVVLGVRVAGKDETYPVMYDLALWRLSILWKSKAA